MLTDLERNVDASDNKLNDGMRRMRKFLRDFEVGCVNGIIISCDSGIELGSLSITIFTYWTVKNSNCSIWRYAGFTPNGRSRSRVIDVPCPSAKSLIRHQMSRFIGKTRVCVFFPPTILRFWATMLASTTLIFALGACLSFSPTALAVGSVQIPGLVVPSKYASEKDGITTMFKESYNFYKWARH